jgi:hypothetical protein
MKAPSASLPPPVYNTTRTNLSRKAHDPPAGVSLKEGLNGAKLHQIIPRNLRANLKLRLGLLRLAHKKQNGAVSRGYIWNLCKNDVLFFINCFAWTINPRTGKGEQPFITYNFQDAAILEIRDAIFKRRSLSLRKSREMGATWMILLVLVWLWIFWPEKFILVVSRNEKYVDETGNHKSLFWKIDYILDRLPSFLIPRYERKKNQIRNLDNGSVIDGEATTGEVARGDRRDVILIDEFAAFEVAAGFAAMAAAQFATDCIIYNSTPQGKQTAFFNVTNNRAIRRLDLHWTMHPLHARGLWKDPDAVKKGPWDGWRSPWYDRKKRELPSLALAAQELDLDEIGAGSPFFDVDLIQTLQTETVREPMGRYSFLYDPFTGEPIELVEDDRGKLLLWTPLLPSGRINPDIEVVFGADVSMGTMASSSVISGGDKRTGEKFLEYSDASIRPENFGRLTAALARFFNGAFVIFERNGPGRIAGPNCLECGYTNLYKREQTVAGRRSVSIGWDSTAQNKASLFGEYSKALSMRRFINPSAAALNECLEFVHDADTVKHVKAMYSDDASSARENHGDIATADALCWLGMKEVVDSSWRGKLEPRRVESDDPILTLAGRMRTWRDQQHVHEGSMW